MGGAGGWLGFRVYVDSGLRGNGKQPETEIKPCPWPPSFKPVVLSGQSYVQMVRAWLILLLAKIHRMGSGSGDTQTPHPTAAHDQDCEAAKD